MVAPSGISRDEMSTDLIELGLRRDDVVLCHSSLSRIGHVDGGAAAVVAALLDVVGYGGTLVTPAFTGAITEPFTAGTPTTMGAIPTAVLAWPGRRRSPHPQASVAAVGLDAAPICERQPMAYALGPGSPFEEIVRRHGRILLMGVGHNRSSMLHHSESKIANHRRKTRQFPVRGDGQISWVEVPDVGDDNDTFFPTVGAEFERRDLSVRSGFVGEANAVLFDADAYDRFAQRRLSELLQNGGG
ncbi:AAC(3) family N-acetyltransferase [Williamsia maris]|uniref:Aminoglycoside N(3)-acetyltransferase n=1 Tax=Williamsia maris TaxID=72806 RepID=A0ABT1HIJ8_9NOCA|nr:AAC(3) family N-acetyltransferase [Williamsia maris]MCP2177748.1 aminoglycoside 3-N-acetyltransferase [Williamsia maris]